MHMSRFMIYGANGFTGELISREAVNRGLTPVLAGRSDKVKTLAEELNLEYMIFSINDDINDKLSDFDILLNCAGPFSSTAKIFIEACLNSKTNYLDITGELAVFEMSKEYNQLAIDNGIVIIPGVGYDVVPTDCLAMYMKEKMNDATHLKIAMYSRGGIPSKGTYKSQVEALKYGFFVRENGKLKEVPFAHKTMEIEFEKGSKRMTMCIPWGDLSTAYTSTGIPNIEIYSATHPKRIKYLKVARYFKFILGTDFMQRYLKSKANKMPKGPDRTTMERSITYLWAEISNRNRNIQARMQVPNGYAITVDAALLIIDKLANTTISGYLTPASAFGVNLLRELRDVTFPYTT